MKFVDYIKSKFKSKESESFLTERYANIPASDIKTINGENSSMNKVDGCHRKQFVRVTGDYFKDLYTEMRNNPNCMYRTYMDDVIKSGYNPKKLSVLIKEADELKYGAYYEVLSSRIANFMGAPTVYNKLHVDENGKKYVMSVDYMKSGYRMIDIIKMANDFYSEIDPDYAYSIYKSYSNMYVFFSDIAHMLRTNLCSSGDNSDSFEDEFFNLFFTRRHVIHDGDFGIHNIGLMTDDKGKTILEPMYDTEMAFSDNLIRNEYLVQDIQKALTRQPQRLKEFDCKFKSLMRPENLRKLFDGINDPKFKKMAIKNLKESYEQFEYNCYLANQNNKTEEKSR